MLTLSGTDTAAHYQSVLDNLAFSSSAADPTNGGADPTRTATWQVTDATNNQLSTPQSETIDISPSYAPTGIGVRATGTEAVQGGAAVTLLSGAPVITDTVTTLASATIQITNGSGAAVAGDKLFVAAVQSGTVSGVTVSWNGTTNTLTLTGSASIATYQTLLSQVTYQDSGTDASSGAHPVRTVTWSVNDGTQTLSATSQVTVDRAPRVTNETGFAVAGTTLSVAAASGALSGDSDLDGDVLAVTSVNGVAGNVGTS